MNWRDRIQDEMCVFRAEQNREPIKITLPLNEYIEIIKYAVFYQIIDVQKCTLFGMKIFVTKNDYYMMLE